MKLEDATKEELIWWIKKHAFELKYELRHFGPDVMFRANDWYEQVGPAYTFHSACIDREAWKPCGECAPNCSWCKNNDESSRTTPKVCRECKRHSNYEPEYKFCCECGRPLTEKAWAELEKRMGV